MFDGKCDEPIMRPRATHMVNKRPCDRDFWPGSHKPDLCGNAIGQCDVILVHPDDQVTTRSMQPLIESGPKTQVPSVKDGSNTPIGIGVRTDHRRGAVSGTVVDDPEFRS